MALEIPKENAGSLEVVKAMPPTSIDKLIAALSSAPLNSNPVDMAANIAKDLPSVSPEQLAGVVDTIYTLYHIRELSGVKPHRFIKDLIDAIGRSEDLQVAPKDIAKLRQVLERLMGIDTLRVVAKAARLQRDGERLYCKAKLLSDIRPVFDQDANRPPVGAVLTHTLKLGYHQGAQHREFHVVLDSDDLEALADVIKRAQSKERTLRTFLKRSRLPNLGE